MKVRLQLPSIKVRVYGGQEVIDLVAEIDKEQLAIVMGGRAFANKVKKATSIHGAVAVYVVGRQVEKNGQSEE